MSEQTYRADIKTCKLKNKTVTELNKVRASLQRSKKAYRSFMNSNGEDDCDLALDIIKELQEASKNKDQVLNDVYKFLQRLPADWFPEHLFALVEQGIEK